MPESLPSKLFDIPDAEFQEILTFLKRDSTQLLHIPAIRLRIAAARVRNLRQEDIRALDDTNAPAIDNTVRHNLHGLLSNSALDRPRRLVYPLVGIYELIREVGDLKVLSVGPRSENELFLLMSIGFKPENITGLDLISYSPLVRLGDMHDMPMADDSFDVVMLGWVLTYSEDIPKAVSEVLRVAKPGAYVAIGWEYYPKDEETAQSASSIVSGTWMEDVDGILALFDGHVARVYFRSQPSEDRLDQRGDLITIFKLKA